MRVVFLGSPDFAVSSLEALATHPQIDVALVVTQPDRPAGRGRRLTSTAVRSAAERLGLNVYQPASLRDPEAAKPLASARSDLLVVVAYGELLRRHVLELAPAGCINVHPSLLPRYRGAAPIPAAILAGDRQTGVTIMRLVRRLDAGPILVQQPLDITRDDTAGSLSDRLAQLAARMLPATAIQHVAGAIEPRPQDELLASYTREWTMEDARIDWADSADTIERLVRASNPWPIAWTTVAGERLRIIDVALHQVSASSADPGVARRHDRTVVVSTGAGTLELVTVQPAGKRAMPAADWWRGAREETLRLGT
jgi:methionyl-tRNA formyltransferase